MEPSQRVSKIREALEHGLTATHVEVVDHSAEHAGHPGAAAGGGHFEVLVVSEQFEGLSRIAAQQLVYRVLGPFMTSDIHAVSMHTLTPGQWRARASQ